MVILDTSIIIDHLRIPATTQSILRKYVAQHPKGMCALSVISIEELYAGKSTHHSETEKNLLATIAPLTILAYTYDTAMLAGKLMRDKPNLTFPDAAIAATAITNQCPLFTLNIKDFSHITNLTLATLDVP